jgi:hypothetical protein
MNSTPVGTADSTYRLTTSTIDDASERAEVGAMLAGMRHGEIELGEVELGTLESGAVVH